MNAYSAAALRYSYHGAMVAAVSTVQGVKPLPAVWGRTGDAWVVMCCTLVNQNWLLDAAQTSGSIDRLQCGPLCGLI